MCFNFNLYHCTEVLRIRTHRRKAADRAAFAAALGHVSGGASSPEDELLAAAGHLSPEAMNHLAHTAGHDISTLGGAERDRDITKHNNKKRTTSTFMGTAYGDDDEEAT